MACFACAQCFLWQRKGINTNIQFHCCKSQRARLNELQHFAADRKTRFVWHAPLPSSPKWLSDNVLLQFKPCHVFLPSSIENHLFFFFFGLSRIWTEGHLKQNCSDVQTQTSPKCLNIKPREHAGWSTFGLWMSVNIVNVYILSVLCRDFLFRFFSC